MLLAGGGAMMVQELIDKLFEFYAGTGKIKGIDNKRGIHALIKLLEEE